MPRSEPRENTAAEPAISVPAFGRGNRRPRSDRRFERALLDGLQSMRRGDFAVRLAGDQEGLTGRIADTFNEIVAANQDLAQQLESVGRQVGREGRVRQRLKFALASGA